MVTSVADRGDVQRAGQRPPSRRPSPRRRARPSPARTSYDAATPDRDVHPDRGAGRHDRYTVTSPAPRTPPATRWPPALDVHHGRHRRDTTAPTVTGRTPAAGATGVAASSTVTATFSEPLQASTRRSSVTRRRRPPVAGNGGLRRHRPGRRRSPRARRWPSSTTVHRSRVRGEGHGREHHDAPATWTFTTAAAPAAAARARSGPATATPAVAGRPRHRGGRARA